MNNIHITLDHSIIDLFALPDDDFAMYQKCLNAYKQNVPVTEYLQIVNNHFGMITKEIFQSPLYQAIQDLEYRLRINQGILKPSTGDDPEQEPFQRDEFLSASQASRKKGVSITAIIKAVNAGRVSGHQDHENGNWKISARSLEQYEPSAARQSAGQSSGGQ